MQTPSSIWSSSIATKILLALTGLALFAFLVVHLAGNVLVFFGPEIFNHYSEQLISNPLVVPLEIGLLAIFLLHVYRAVRVTLANRAARPQSYAQKSRAGGTSRKSLSSTSMIWTGLITLVFVAIHLRGFKFGPYYEYATDTGVIRDLYRLEVEAFSNPLVAGFYALASLLVGMHLWHGVWSSLQSLGATSSRGVQRIGWTLAAIIAIGFFVIPLWVYVVGSRS